MTQPKLEFLEPWYEALNSPGGIGKVFATDDVERLKAKLLQARRDALDPALEQLVITSSPTIPNQIWILRRYVETEESGTP